MRLAGGVFPVLSAVLPVVAALVGLAGLEVLYGWRAVLVMLCAGAFAGVASLTAVRVEAALALLEREQQQLRQMLSYDESSPEDVLQASAGWAAEVFTAISQGVPASEAVARTAPRVRIGAAKGPVDAASDVSTTSTDEYGDGSGGGGGDWISRAQRSIGQQPLDGERAEELRRVARMGTVPEEIQWHGQPIVPHAARPSRSPEREPSR